MWTADTPLTVGDLRRTMEGLPDDAPAFVDGGPDRPVVGVIQSQQIPWDNDDWQEGDATVLGIEFWLGGDDEFPALRCQHAQARDAALVQQGRDEVAAAVEALHVSIADDSRPDARWKPWCSADGHRWPCPTSAAVAAAGASDLATIRAEAWDEGVAAHARWGFEVANATRRALINPYRVAAEAGERQ